MHFNLGQVGLKLSSFCAKRFKSENGVKVDHVVNFRGSSVLNQLPDDN